MKYALLLHVDSSFEARPGAPEWDAAIGAHTAFQNRLKELDREPVGAALRDVSSATTLRVRDGERLVTDGPFAETAEQLWGFYVVEADDEAQALEFAGLTYEAQHGTVEVRPVIEMEDDCPSTPSDDPALMRYVVLLYAPADVDQGPDSEVWQAAMPAHVALGEKLGQLGYDRGGAPLAPPEAAKSLRVRDGQPLVTDGPFAETKEALWGYYEVGAPDLDTVLDLFEGLWEAEHGSIEVRPCVFDASVMAADVDRA